MRLKGSTMVAGSVLVWIATLAAFSEVTGSAAVQKTTAGGVYSKAQADGAKAQYDKLCADCHPFTVAGKKRPADVPLGGEPFFENWEGRSLDQLMTTIALTMPNDGSAIVTDAEAANLVAYILQQNGFPAGTKALAKDAGAVVVARPKK
jgi:mono/diheme cytochrome c family protein